MKHIWSVLCQTALTSQETHNVSLIEVIEEVQFSTPEELEEGVLPVSINLVTSWQRSDLAQPEKTYARIIIRDPGDKVIPADQSNQYEVNLDQFSKFRTTVKFMGFPFRGDGEYKFEVEGFQDNEWTLFASVPLTLRRQPMP